MLLHDAFGLAEILRRNDFNYLELGSVGFALYWDISKRISDLQSEVEIDALSRLTAQRLRLAAGHQEELEELKERHRRELERVKSLHFADMEDMRDELEGANEAVVLLKAANEELQDKVYKQEQVISSFSSRIDALSIQLANQVGK